jgi:hypothetical protein
LVTPNLGTPSAAVLTSATGLPVSTGLTGLGAGVATALAAAPRAAGGFETTFTATTAIAAAGTTQGTATALTATADDQIHEVTTVAASSGVILPSSSASMRQTVTNRGASPLAVYPASTGTIDGGAASAAITVGINQSVTFYGKDAVNNWYTMRGATYSATAPPVNAATGSTGTSTDFARADHVHPLPTALNSIPIGATTASTGAFTTLTASGAVTLSPASAAVAISPTGTGTVAISPAGALTVNPTAASTINNTSIGATTASTGRFTTLTTTGAATLASGTINGMTVGATTPSTGAFTTLAANSAITYHAPVTVTAATYTVLATDYAIIFNTTAACTVTLGTATAGRTLKINNIAAFAITSATANVTPRTSATAGTAVLAGAAGTWAELIGDGTNWRVIAGN